jgi:hypothetical protein
MNELKKNVSNKIRQLTVNKKKLEFLNYFKTNFKF